jgi:hypothetical protein
MASIPYEFACDKGAGFLPDPNQHNRVGYITHPLGFNSTAPKTLTPDLQVFAPYNSAGPNYSYPAATLDKEGSTNGFGKLHVVGVIEKFAWNGGAGDSLAIDFWCSQQNAAQIKAAQQSTLTTTRVDSLNWWIINFDQEKKVWFEQAYPQSGTTVTGLVGPKDNPELNVDLNGAPAKDGIDVLVYKVSLSVVPSANLRYGLHFANSADQPTVKSWGLVVNTVATAALTDPS